MRENLFYSLNVSIVMLNLVIQPSTVTVRKAIPCLVYRMDCTLKGGSCVMYLFLLYVPIMVFLYVALNSSTEHEVGNCLTTSPSFFLLLPSAFHLSVLSFTRLTSRYYYEKHPEVWGGFIKFNKCS